MATPPPAKKAPAAKKPEVVTPTSGQRRFEFNDEKSSKFWEIAVSGSDVTVRFGRIGTTGQTQTKSFADDAAATKHADKLVAEKVEKGYVEG